MEAIEQATPITQPIIQWTTWRCPKCNRILARVRLTSGSAVEVKCKHCNQILAIVEAA